MTRKFRLNRMDSLRKSKKVEKWLFFGRFWANFGSHPSFSHPSHTILMPLRKPLWVYSPVTFGNETTVW